MTNYRAVNRAMWVGVLLFLVSCTPSGSKPIAVDTLNQPGQGQTGRFRLTNTGSEAITFTLESRSNTRDGQAVEQWYTLKPQEATLEPGASVDVELATNNVFSPPGSYRSEVVVSYPGGPTVFEVAAQIPSPTGPQVSLSPSSLTLQPGQSGSATIGSNNFSGDVTLSFSRGNDGLPADQLSISGSPTTISNTTTATLTVTPKSGAAAGTYKINVTGKSGSETATATLSVTVPGPGGPGNGSISGVVKTENALIPLTPVTPNGAASLSLNQQEAKPDYVPGQLLVKVNADVLTSSEETYRQLASSLALEYPITVLRSGDTTMPALVTVAPGQDVETVAKWLERDPRVAYAEPNYYIYAQAVPTDPQNNQLWNMPASGLPVAWSAKNSATVTVAVIDTGIDLDHPDLKGIFVNNGYDFCANITSGQCTKDANPRPDAPADQHGTHVTGTLAAVGNNNQGVAGVLWGGARVLPVKAFSSSGSTTADALSQAIRWASGLSVAGVPANADPAKIINLSLGTQQQSATLKSAVEAAQGAGALIIAAAGNAGTGTVFYPAQYSGVVGVGSVNSKFQRSCFSSFGTGLDIMAAGGDGFLNTASCQSRSKEAVWSTLPNNNYGIEAGTSMATPVVAGVAALVWSQTTNPTPAKVTQTLKNSAYFDSSYMTADQYGAGLLRADVALGLPGPTSSRRTVDTTVTASGGGSATDIVKLDLLLGVSDAFSLTGLSAGMYTLEAATSGVSLSGKANVTLQSGGAQKDIIVTP